MSLVSMTGFARAAGAMDPWRWVWELKTVNAKGLDLRLRAPSGFDAVESEARTRLGKTLGRGTCYANLSAHRDAGAPQLKVNEQALFALQKAIANVPLDPSIRTASLNGLLNIRGVVELSDSSDDEKTVAAVSQAMLESFDQALVALVAMRHGEGAAMQAVLTAKIDSIAALTASAETCPDRLPEIVRARLERSIQEITGASPALDPARLHQEALLLAAKADVREELDRLHAHVAAVRDLLAQDGPVGRRLDFLAQELGREANTLCAKSNGRDLTTIGMELRVQVEQFREQVQNIE
jgi:uncharacterized protein (TIGR00255 family)